MLHRAPLLHMLAALAILPAAAFTFARGALPPAVWAETGAATATTIQGPAVDGANVSAPDVAGAAVAVETAQRFPRELAIQETLQHPPFNVYVPDVALPAGASFDAVLVLHGIGIDGSTMAAASLSRAQGRGLVVIAPTLAYGDWRSPAAVRDEDLRLVDQLANVMAAVGVEAHVPVSDRVLVFGFSRGAQLATRFALFHPEGVRSVAAFDAGTYTLPVTAVPGPSGRGLTAPLPYGVADFQAFTGRPLNLSALTAIPWLVGAGVNDNRVDDVPRQWDPYLGTSRVERAQRFAGALIGAGIPAYVAIVPNTAHDMNGAVLDQVYNFFDHAPAA